MEFAGDELVLALVSLVRQVDPTLLRQGADGFTVDFAGLDAKLELSDDEILLMKLRAALDTPVEKPAYSIPLSATEATRLSEAVTRVETLREWPADLVRMSRALRARLDALSGSREQGTGNRDPNSL